MGRMRSSVDCGLWTVDCGDAFQREQRIVLRVVLTKAESRAESREISSASGDWRAVFDYESEREE